MNFDIRKKTDFSDMWKDTNCRCFGPGSPQPTSEFELRAPNLGW